MTEGSNANRSADARPDVIELTYIHADLAAAISRMDLVVRLSACEHAYMARWDEAGRNAVLARWQQTNVLLLEAMAEAGRTHTRLDAAARHVFQAVGEAEDRADECKSYPT